MRKLLLIIVCTLLTFHLWPQCVDQNTVSVTIQADWSPYETRWSLRDGVTGVIIDSNSISKDVCVDTSICLTFTIYDTYGDGMCCNNGQGKYVVTLNDDTIVSGGSFGYYEVTSFNCNPGFSCAEPHIAHTGDTINCTADNWFLFVPDSTGIYEVSTCGMGNSCNTKMYIYDRCVGVTPGEGVAGTTFYNDDNCDTDQAAIIGAFGAGYSYYIRVGDYNNQCASNNIKWFIKYNGPVVGCMDSLSCNYNPLATVSNGSCLTGPNPACPGPDLIVVQSDLENNLYIDYTNVNTNNCYIDEGCLSGYGQRTLLRFTTHIRNIGDADYFIGQPDSTNPAFEIDACHNHWHYVGYAHYVLYNQHGKQVGAGYKTGFCVEDLVCDSFGMAKYSCGNMGITAGCGDVYNSATDCQWIDITEIDTGNYSLSVTVNWNHNPDVLDRHEKNYDNNEVLVCFNLYYDANGNKLFALMGNCTPRIDCAGDTMGFTQTDCENVCNGSSVYGDINTDFTADTLDVEKYIADVLNDNITYTPCADLTSDNSINVADIVRLNACLLCKNGKHQHVYSVNNNQHNHCTFPLNVVNPFDTVGFTITTINWTQKYIDISIFNPSSTVLACQMQVSGIQADSAVSLLNDSNNVLVNISPHGHLLAMSLNEVGFARMQTPSSCIRIYFNIVTDSEICISNIISVINSKYEQVARKGSAGCIKTLVNTIEHTVTQRYDLCLLPNPADNRLSIIIPFTLLSARVQLVDVHGRTITPPTSSMTLNKMEVDLSDIPSGVYVISLLADDICLSKRLMIVH